MCPPCKQERAAQTVIAVALTLLLIPPFIDGLFFFSGNDCLGMPAFGVVSSVLFFPHSTPYHGADAALTCLRNREDPYLSFFEAAVEQVPLIQSARLLSHPSVADPSRLMWCFQRVVAAAFFAVLVAIHNKRQEEFYEEARQQFAAERKAQEKKVD